MHPTSITSLEIVLTKAPHQHQHHKTSLSLNFPPWRKAAISHIVHCLLQIWVFLMALKCAFIWVCAKIPHSHLGVPNLEARRYGVASELKLHKREFCCLALVAKQPLTPLDDEKPYGSGLASSDAVNRALGIKSLVLQKDLSLLPKPLSVNELLSSPDDGTKVRVAYQGIAGAYSEAAALKAYPDCETVPCDQFESAFKAVELWLVDKAVLPIENSLGGSIHRNYDLLLRHRLHIVREVQMAVNHCLLGLPGVRKDELKCVLSHPQALAQCEMTLGKLGLVRVNADDSAGAAQMVALSGKRDTGAIASSRAAEIYGLDILAEKIQDCNENITRFLILAREPIIPGIKRHYKTSIVFSLEEGPGMLFKALAVFAMRDISLSKIESRPQQKRPLRVVDDSSKGSPKYFDYLFYIDFEASMAEPRAQYALGHLQEFSTFLRILGCYPMDTGI